MFDLLGPLGFPLLGAIHEIKQQNAVHLDFDRLSKKYGEIFSLYLGKEFVHKTVIAYLFFTHSN